MKPSNGSATSDRVVLEERARKIARRMETCPEVATIEVLAFRLAQERFAVETRLVRRVENLPKVTRVPSVSEMFLGVINLHGDLIPLVDLQRLLSIPSQSTLDSAGFVVVLGREQAELALAAESIEGTIGVEILQPAHAPAQPLAQFVTSDALTVLDTASILSDARLTTSILTPASNNTEGDSL